jgi:polyisoprenoid-binding protein YceI
MQQASHRAALTRGAFMSDATTRTVDGVVLPAPGTWAIDTSHSSVEFSVRHLVIGKTKGRFANWSGTVQIAEEPTASSVNIEIDAASIDTKDETRDGHLRTNDFLEVDQHPKLTFTSTAVKGSGTDWVVAGDLTIRGVTRPVELNLELEGVVEKDPWGLARAAFSGQTEINREDFGLTWNQALESGGVLVGKKVTINLEVEAVKQG